MKKLPLVPNITSINRKAFAEVNANENSEH